MTEVDGTLEIVRQAVHEGPEPDTLNSTADLYAEFLEIRATHDRDPPILVGGLPESAGTYSESAGTYSARLKAIRVEQKRRGPNLYCAPLHSG